MISLNKPMNENRLYVVATILLSLIFILVSNAEAVTCDTCSSCDSAAATANNLIQLTSNITSHGSCINIKANNIILDCQGNRIEGNGTSANSSILIDGGFNNTFIRNCNITSSLYGINSRMINLYNLTIINTTIYNNTYGIALSALTNASFINNTIMNNTQLDIYFNKSINITFVNNHLIRKITIVESYATFYNLSLGNSTTSINLVNMTLLESDTMFNTTSDVDLRSNTANVLNNSEIYNRSTSITITFNDANSSSIDAYTILRNNAQCRLPSCNKISNNPRIFNVTGLSNYTTINLTCGSYLVNNISLDANLVNDTGGNRCSSDGLILNTSRITLDCNGYEILGNRSNGRGILFNNVSHSHAKNCNVTSFLKGVEVNRSSNSIVFNNTILINSTRRGDGILMYITSNSNISFNKIVTNGSNDAGMEIYGDVLSSTTYFSEYNNITNNIIFTFATDPGDIDNAYGIYPIEYARANRILHNNITVYSRQTPGIPYLNGNLASLSNNIIAFNNITTFGATASAIYSQIGTISNFNITKNSIHTYGLNSYGIEIISGGNPGNNITENTIYTEGSAHAVSILSSNNLIKDNNITTMNISSSAILLQSGSQRNNITGNNLTTYNNNSHVIYIDGANNNRIGNNQLESTGFNVSAIIFGTGTSSTNITNNIIKSTGDQGKGIYSVDVVNTNYSHLTINVTSYDFFFMASNGTTLVNITSGLLYYINYTNFTAINLTIRNENGNIKYENITTNITKENAINTTGNIIINSNFVRINSTAAWAFNTSANITINGLTSSNPRPLIDLQDSGTYDFCGSCTEINYSGGAFTFAVGSFTTYSSEETPSSGGQSGGSSGGGSSDGNGGGGGPKPQVPVQEEPQQEPQKEPEKPAEVPEGTKIIETEEGAIIIHSAKGEGGSYDLILNTTRGVGEIMIKFVNATGGITVPKLDIRLTTKGPIKIMPAIDVKLPIIDGLNFLLLMIIITALFFFTEWRKPKKDSTLPHLRYIPYNYPKAYKQYDSTKKM